MEHKLVQSSSHLRDTKQNQMEEEDATISDLFVEPDASRLPDAEDRPRVLSLPGLFHTAGVTRRVPRGSRPHLTLRNKFTDLIR